MKFSQKTILTTKAKKMHYMIHKSYPMAVVAQLVRALDCGSRGRGFESRRSPIFPMAQKKSNNSRSKAKAKKQQLIELPPKRDYTELNGALLLCFSLISLVGLFSFAFHGPQENALGLVGEKLGWFLHALFGVGSYLICIYFSWIGWRVSFQKPINRPAFKAFWFFVMVASFCFLLCLIEDSFASAGTFLQQQLYPSLWHRKLYYHLGGAFFHYLYKDLPGLNLYRIFNSVGSGIIFTTSFVASVLYLLKCPPRTIIAKITEWLAKPKEQDEPLLVAIAAGKTIKDTAPKTSTAANILRYVRLKIPSNSLPSQDGSVPTGSQHELLEIQPEQNLKTRPSMSGKQSTAPQQEKPKKKDSFEDLADLELPQFEDAPSFKPSSSTPAKISKRKEPIQIPLERPEEALDDFKNYKLPTTTLLSQPKKVDQSSLKKDLKRQAEVLEETLQSFGIEAKVGQINCGPTINSFEVHPAIGVKVQKIKALENDIALNMEAKSIRIIAPIPGKAAVGIEIPTSQPQEVAFKDLLQAYNQASKKFHIPILLGKAVNGDFVMNDLTKMPHCIIAGATGSGKSVCINTIVMSILLTSKPDEIKLIMVDPKKVELTPYTNLPHMLAPVITEPHGAAAALQWLVKEMEKRYEILKRTGTRNIDSFNNRTSNREQEDQEIIPEKLYYIVCIIDELADLMMVSSGDIETPIARIAQMARAVGIHMILATQRPSREVITGIIKANFPTRIAFKVASRINSQIILDETGAETLLGNGDMLFLPPGTSHLTRAQGAFIRDEDINAVIKFLCDQAPPNYKIASFDSMSRFDLGDDDYNSSGNSASTTHNDSLYEQALEIVQTTGNASTTFLQRKLKIGYARAASLTDELEANGIIGPAEGARPRKILKQNQASKLSQECADPKDNEEELFDAE